MPLPLPILKAPFTEAWPICGGQGTLRQCPGPRPSHSNHVALGGGTGMPRCMLGHCLSTYCVHSGLIPSTLTPDVPSEASKGSHSECLSID